MNFRKNIIIKPTFKNVNNIKNKTYEELNKEMLSNLSNFLYNVFYSNCKPIDKI